MAEITEAQFANELRIRANGGHEGYKELEIMCGKAADAITELQSRLASVTAERDKWKTTAGNHSTVALREFSRAEDFKDLLREARDCIVYGDGTVRAIAAIDAALSAQAEKADTQPLEEVAARQVFALAVRYATSPEITDAEFRSVIGNHPAVSRASAAGIGGE